MVAVCPKAFGVSEDAGDVVTRTAVYLGNLPAMKTYNETSTFFPRMGLFFAIDYITKTIPRKGSYLVLNVTVIIRRGYFHRICVCRRALPIACMYLYPPADCLGGNSQVLRIG